jgi:hypothetical protein
MVIVVVVLSHQASRWTDWRQTLRRELLAVADQTMQPTRRRCGAAAGPAMVRPIP